MLLPNYRFRKAQQEVKLDNELHCYERFNASSETMQLEMLNLISQQPGEEYQAFLRNGMSRNAKSQAVKIFAAKILLARIFTMQETNNLFHIADFLGAAFLAQAQA